VVEHELHEYTEHAFSNVKFTLHLRRLPLYYVMNLIVPCCLLSSITLTTFLLPPGVPHRSTIGMSCLVLCPPAVRWIRQRRDQFVCVL